MNPNTNHILVAGATGYLGGHAVEEFKRRGNYVRALARSAEKLAALSTQPDEIFQAKVTEPESLFGVCKGIDVVFSSLGITRQKDGLTFQDVDYQGNLNLLIEAKRAGVRKFIYVSVLNGPNLLHLDIVKAHEDFVAELEKSGLDYTIVRPTGYFSDMGEFLDMAKKGRVWLVGSGENRMNPIHGADLAKVCVDAVDSTDVEINVGGPEIMTYRQMAETAFKALDTKPKISSTPAWLMKAIVAITRLFNRHQGELLAFFTTMMLNDVVAPKHGKHKLFDHYEQLSNEWSSEGRAEMEQI